MPANALRFPAFAVARLHERSPDHEVEVFGPQVAGARAKADLQLDFGGGFERAPNGVNAGLFRLRTGTMRPGPQKKSTTGTLRRFAAFAFAPTDAEKPPPPPMLMSTDTPSRPPSALSPGG